MNTMHEEIFYDISWSTEKVYKQTTAIISRLGLRILELPQLIDIDTEEDLWKWFNSDSSRNSVALRDFTRRLATSL